MCHDSEEDATLPKSGLKWHVEWNAPITLPTLTQRLHEEGLGREDLAAILEARSTELTDQLCGPRYHPMPNARYKRAGTRRRTLGTRFGKIHVKVHRVKNLNGGKTFVPIWQDVLIDPKKTYQRDVDALAEQFATRMTYRNTSEELGKVVEGAPSAHTINRRVMEDGAELTKYLHERELKATTHQPDGTKLHAQEKKGHHDVNIIIASGNGRPRLRSITVGKAWEDHASMLERTKFENARGEPIPGNVVSDMERGLKDLVTPEGGFWQPCLVHVVRNTGYALWEDRMSQDEEKESIVSTVAGLLEHLKNSLALHLPKGETDAVKHRIKQTTKEFRRLATRLWNDGKRRTAKFLRSVSAAVTTFATLALNGIVIPWHNNLVERLMGEVSKRCKHKWMSCSPSSRCAPSSPIPTKPSGSGSSMARQPSCLTEESASPVWSLNVSQR